MRGVSMRHWTGGHYRCPDERQDLALMRREREGRPCISWRMLRSMVRYGLHTIYLNADG